MAKTWDEMTTEEKVEDLRRDVKTIMDAVNSSNEAQRELSKDHRRVSNMLAEVAKAVEEIERKVQE